MTSMPGVVGPGTKIANKILTKSIEYYTIQDYYPKAHSSYKRLREAIQEAWNSITHERIRELVHGMRERCLAVIRARGWYTKY